MNTDLQSPSLGHPARLLTVNIIGCQVGEGGPHHQFLNIHMKTDMAPDSHQQYQKGEDSGTTPPEF